MLTTYLVRSTRYAVLSTQSRLTRTRYLALRAQRRPPSTRYSVLQSKYARPSHGSKSVSATFRVTQTHSGALPPCVRCLGTDRFWPLTASAGLEKQQFADAASRLREAGRLGCRDRRLGGLLMLALVKEGQRQLQEAGTRSALRSGQKPEEALAAAARLFDQAITSGCRQPEVAYLLAMAYKRQDKLREARETLRKNALPDANVFLQLAVLS